MRKIIYGFIFLLMTSFVWHKYYVSVTEIYIKEHKLEIIMRIFPDDMENALKDNYSLKSGLMTQKAKAYLEWYLNDHFEISADGKVLPYTIEGVLQEDGFFIILMQAQKKKNIKQLCITNTVLTGLFDNQKNILHFLHGDQKQSFILQKPDLSVCIDLKD